MAEIVILGAGLTGMSAAYRLESQNYLDYEIFEQDSRPGGLLKAESADGFNFDYTGHLLHISNPDFYNFLDEILGVDKNLILNKRNSAIFYSDTFVQYPFQVNLHGLPSDIIYDCLAGYVNRNTGIKKPANFYQWVLKYFGPGLGKHFFFPYNGKLLNYDVKKILPSWTGRFVPQTSLELILRGALEKQTDLAIGYNNSFYYPKTGGIEILIKSIEKKLSKKIKTNYKAVFIDLKNKEVLFENGHTEKYKKLITTMPLKDLLASTATFKHLSDKFLCSSVINFNLGFNLPDIGPWHWLYFPEKRFEFYRVGFWNNISSSCVRSGCTGIYGETSYLQGTKSQKQIDDLTLKSVKQALSFLALTEKNTAVQKNLHMKYAYVIYDLWRERNIQKILGFLEQASIYSIGRFGGWNYSSMQEAFIDGQRSVDQVLKEIGVISKKNSLGKESSLKTKHQTFSSKIF